MTPRRPGAPQPTTERPTTEGLTAERPTTEGPGLDGLSVEGLSVAVRGRTLVDDATWTAPAGCVTAVIGPNGAGKSTMLRAIAGATPERSRSRGTILLHGEALSAMAGRARARRVALVEQSTAADGSLTGMEAVRIGRTPHHRALGFSLGDDAIVEHAMRAAGAWHVRDARLATCSGGELQRIHLARGLAQEPRLLLLDEPTNHLDVAAQLELLALVRRIASGGFDETSDAERMSAGPSSQRGTVVVTLHDLSLAAQYADHVVVVLGGRIVAEGTPLAVLTPERIRAVWNVDARVVIDERGIDVRLSRIEHAPRSSQHDAATVSESRPHEEAR